MEKADGTVAGKRCTDPGTPGGMDQVDASFEVDGLVRYNCRDPGYVPTAAVIKCIYNQTTDTASWNDTLPSCIGKHSLCVKYHVGVLTASLEENPKLCVLYLLTMLTIC